MLCCCADKPGCVADSSSSLAALTCNSFSLLWVFTSLFTGRVLGWAAFRFQLRLSISYAIKIFFSPSLIDFSFFSFYFHKSISFCSISFSIQFHAANSPVKFLRKTTKRFFSIELTTFNNFTLSKPVLFQNGDDKLAKLLLCLLFAQQNVKKPFEA